MPTPTLTPDDQRQDEERNVGQQNSDQLFNRLSDAERRPGSTDMSDFEKSYAGDSADGAPDSANDYARQREAEAASGAPGGAGLPASFRNNVTGPQPKKIQLKGPLKRFGPLLGIGGVFGIIALVLFALMPFKLNMFVENITKIASEVPGYAIERRTEYMATRLLAIHLMKQAGGIAGTDSDAATKAVFCKNASISCSLLTTYGANYFDNLIEVSRAERFGNNVRMTIVPKGVSSLGGNARSWTVEVARDMGDGQLLRTTQNLQSNAEAKAYVKNMVNKDLKTKNIAVRYLARSILMKKYGITHWRAFEKTSNKIDETRTKMKTSILRNTVGKVSARTSLYLGCLTNSDVCASLKDGFVLQAGNLQEQIDGLDPGPERDRLEAKKEALDKLSGNTPLSDEDLAGGSTKDIIIKRLIAVAGVAGAIGTIDLVFGAVEAIDNGALEQISADMAKVSYIGFGFGDETGMIPNKERIMAGDGDLEVYGELTSLFEGAEQSPLMQYENGLLGAAEVTNGSLTRTCTINDEQKAVTLEKGELVCPERTIVRDYTSLLSENPSFSALGDVARVWNNTIGGVIDVITTTLGNLPIISHIGELVSELSKPLMEWAMSLFFVPPPVGYETTGQNNYDALSGAIRVSQNALMEEGVGEDGTAYGAGGSLLSDEEVAAISNEVRAEAQAEFESQSMVARIFDPYLSGSFAQKFLAQLPTSFNSFIALPSTSFATFARASTQTGSAYATTAVNPMNLDIYGYALNDPALTADPGVYTEESCAQSAEVRAASYMPAPDRSTVPTYGVSDPCALEKMVVGSMLQAAGVTDDPYSLKEPSAEAAPSSQPVASTGRPAEAIDKGQGWTLAYNKDYSTIACDPRTQDEGVFTSTRYGFTIRLCLVTYQTRPSNANGSSMVNAAISTNVMNMLEAAKADGLNIGIADAMRKDGGSTQYYSEHATGLALDLNVAFGPTICNYGANSRTGWGSAENAERQCAAIGGEQYAAYKWLQANASQYGFYNYTVEPWHWSTSGS